MFSSRSSMEWTEKHDHCLCQKIQKILARVEPFKFIKWNVVIGEIWEKIANNPNDLESRFRVWTKRAVRERYSLLSGKFKPRCDKIRCKVSQSSRCSPLSKERAAVQDYHAAFGKTKLNWPVKLCLVCAYLHLIGFSEQLLWFEFYLVHNSLKQSCVDIYKLEQSKLKIRLVWKIMNQRALKQ